MTRKVQVKRIYYSTINETQVLLTKKINDDYFYIFLYNFHFSSVLADKFSFNFNWNYQNKTDAFKG